MSNSLTKGRKGVLMTITPEGSIDIDGQNFTKADGSACKVLSDALRGAIGGKLVSETKKPEYAENGALRVTE